MRRALSNIGANLNQTGAKMNGVFLQSQSPPRFGPHDPQGGRRRRTGCRRWGGRVDEGPGLVEKVVDHHLRPGDDCTGAGEGFAQRRHDDVNGIENAHIVLDHTLDRYPDGSFNIIALNPPIEEGTEAIFEMIDRARPKLRNGGSFYLIAKVRKGAKSYMRKLSVPSVRPR